MRTAICPKNEAARRTMQANRSKNTKLELHVRKLLWADGLRGYRIHNKKLPGTPDVSFASKKIAVFIHGCFWHGHTMCKQYLPKHNSAFWLEKLERNKKKDQKHIDELKRMGWRVFVIWECEKKEQYARSLQKIKDAYRKTRLQDKC